MVGNDEKLLLWNRAFEQLTCFPATELAEAHPADFFQADIWEREKRIIREVLQKGESRVTITRCKIKAGEEVPVELKHTALSYPQGEPIVLIQFKNLTDKQRLEAELQQSQKMEAIGKLAGGIAHDFNNVLTTILGLTEAMMNGRTPPNAESLREIHHAGKHAADLTHSLLAFSRRQILQMKIIRLEDVVENMARMVGRVIGEDIRLEILHEPSLPPVRADQSQIEQVVLNLCLNARDAMPAGGNLRLAVRSEILNESDCNGKETERPGRYVVLSVQDTGEGIAPEILPHVFEPFFTRKAVGKGTGLGLSMVYGIVQQHEGFIRVSSEVGRGTEFAIFFPPGIGEPQPLRIPSVSSSPEGSATILVVEDDKSVRRLVLEALPRLGYRVFTAADGEEALKVFQRWADQIDLILLDAIIPKKGSREVYEAIKERKPTVKFLFTSGYNEIFINQKFEMDPTFLFLRKPFTMLELASMIRTALD
ncbi:MAG: hypothetical protein A3F68_06680 [Acidobacteria bacterium RIFCSPLOWO2_12_FULL_54_10]|nr:MAG: hypothetical protein A3F68_06680 [Acidobacteria bacterium RIFCSPLOWO2_12_FULL_54_10]